MDTEADIEDTRDYEVAVLMANETEEPLWGESIAVVQKEGSKVVQLAYPIKKHLSATLRVYVIRCAPAVAHALHASLQSHHGIIRHLLITPPLMTRRRASHAVVRSGERMVKNESAKPASSEMVSNQALEEVLEKILKNNESQ